MEVVQIFRGPTGQALSQHFTYPGKLYFRQSESVSHQSPKERLLRSHEGAGQPTSCCERASSGLRGGKRPVISATLAFMLQSVYINTTQLQLVNKLSCNY